jgi:hypothetical protein
LVIGYGFGYWLLVIGLIMVNKVNYWLLGYWLYVGRTPTPNEGKYFVVESTLRLKIIFGVVLQYEKHHATIKLPDTSGGEKRMTTTSVNFAKGKRIPPQMDLQAEIDRLQAENEALKAKRTGPLSMKVSEKGAVSVYGLMRFPVTLYGTQWVRLMANGKSILQFVADHESELSVKE